MYKCYSGSKEVDMVAEQNRRVLLCGGYVGGHMKKGLQKGFMVDYNMLLYNNIILLIIKKTNT